MLHLIQRIKHLSGTFRSRAAFILPAHSVAQFSLVLAPCGRFFAPGVGITRGVDHDFPSGIWALNVKTIALRWRFSS